MNTVMHPTIQVEERAYGDRLRQAQAATWPPRGAGTAWRPGFS